MTLIVGLCALVAVVTHRYAPSRAIGATLAVSGALTLIAAILTGNLQSLASVVIISCVAWYAGSAIYLLAFPGPTDPATSVAIGIPLGFSLLGMVAFALSLINAFNGLALATAALLIVIASGMLHRKRTGVFLSRPVPAISSVASLDALQIGLCAGAIVFALLAAFSPEVMFDPFRQHLPIAIRIWETGSLAEVPRMAVSRDPIMGHVLFAMAYGYGGVHAATLMHAVVGLASIAGVIAGARVVSSSPAGMYAAAAFAAMPLVLWEIGHAYTDLFPPLFTASAVLMLLRWQSDGIRTGLVIAGLLCGAGIAAKLTMIWVSLALLVAILVVGRETFSWKSRLSASVFFTLGHVIALPWLVRSLMIAGGLPGKVSLALASVTERIPVLRNLVSIPADPGFHPVSTEIGGFGHGAVDLLTVPWSVTFWADRFPDFSLGGGDIGLLLPLLIPFAIAARQNRRMALLWVTALITYLAWWATPLQITRHLAPTLAVLAMLAGCGAAYLLNANTRPAWIHTGFRLLSCTALIGSLVLFANGRFSQVPFDLFVGRITADEYAELNIPAYRELQSASASLPAGSSLLYIGKWGGAQLYVSADLVNAGQETQETLDEQFGQTDATVLAELQKLGTTQILWDRNVTKPEDWSADIVSLDFLSRNTRVVDFSESHYLFGLVPDAESYWNTDRATTLLVDPMFKTFKRKNSQWVSSGRVKRDEDLVTPRRGSPITQTVNVEPGTTYLLVTSVVCPDRWSRTTLAIRWLDALGNEISVTSQELFPGPNLGDQFILGTAPTNAVTGTVEIGGRSNCDFSRADLLAQPRHP